MDGWLGLDTETTGKDIHHGADAYLVSFCDTEYNNTFYEWDVDPLTRKVLASKQDKEEIAHTILMAKGIVIQNAKFDISVLVKALPPDFVWPYEVTHDTTFAAHLIASNRAKDLTTLALDVLETDITRYEDAVADAAKACRRLVRRKNSPISNWRIAKEGLPEMPSVKKSPGKGQDKQWKLDMWILRAVIKFAQEQAEVAKWAGLTDLDEHPWLTLTSEYCTTDSTCCLNIFFRQMEVLEELGLWEIYEARRELIPCLVDMEHTGVTISRARHTVDLARYKEISNLANSTCVNIAKSYGYDLVLPKNGTNKSLTGFMFGPGGFDPISIGNNRKKKTATPSLDKKVLFQYEATLPQRSKQHRFVTGLINHRAAGTSIGYLDSYEKFRLAYNNSKDTCILYPHLNPTGSNTLRFTSSNPNEQQISKREGFNLRYVFGPAIGREWWSLDAKNIELRIPAYESGQRELISLFEQPDEPPYYGSTHLLNFSTIYPDIWQRELLDVGIEQVGPHCKDKYESTWYQWCKNFGFAVQYGAQDREDGEGTADIAAHKPGAQALVKSRFAALNALNQKWIDFANATGYVETIPDRSVNPERGYPMYCTRTDYGRVKPTVPLAYHVQGTAMQWMYRAMVRCREQLLVWNSMLGSKGFFMVMQIHDECVFDFPVGRGKEPWRTNLPKVRQLAKLMSQGGEDIGVPTPVGIEYHDNNFAESRKIA